MAPASMKLVKLASNSKALVGPVCVTTVNIVHIRGQSVPGFAPIGQ